MKNILLCACLLSYVLLGCEQEDSFYYEETPTLYFVSAVGDQSGKMSKEIDFAFRRTGKKDKNWMYDLYYGDSLRVDTLKLVVSLLGKLSDQPREYNLEVVDSLSQGKVILQNPYILEANATRDTIAIAVIRPENRGEFSVILAFSESSDFDKTALKDAGRYSLKLSDHYPRPKNWNDQIYGEYSEEKYAFWVTVLETVYENAWAFYDDWWRPTTRINELIDALNEYNAAHPDAPKDFTFPGM